MQNIGRSSIRGLEAGVDTRILGWDAHITATVMRPHNDIDGTILTRRAERSLKVAVDRSFGCAHVHVNWIAVGRRFDKNYMVYPLEPVRLSGYGLLGVNLEYALSPHWSVNAALNNVFDRTYETMFGYNQLGRTVFVGVRYRGIPWGGGV